MHRGIDHLVICVSDLDAASALFRNLGFTVTPRAQHPWGTDNTLVQLEGQFLELLTIARPELIEPSTPTRFSFGEFAAARQAEREGMSMLVFESFDAQADRDEFLERGLSPYEGFYFERSARQPDGSDVTVAFSLAFALTPALPRLAFFCCQQHAPQYFWKSEYQEHANSAFSIEEVLMVSEHTAPLADFFARVQEPASVTTTTDGLLVTTPRSNIRVLSPAAAARRFPGAALPASSDGPEFLGARFRCANRGALEQAIESSGVEHQNIEDTVVVLPRDAFGMALEFR